jgi:hypothetical protein
VILNPKGGAHKTTSTLLLAATFGTQRGGATLAWDNNETRGTLGWRAQNAPHHRTAVDLLEHLDSFAEPSQASLAALDTYVRTQVDARFDVLASDEDAAASSTIDAAAFDRLHGVLSRYYRLLIVDTGNNMRASNWVAAVAAADQLVIVSTVREDTAACRLAARRAAREGLRPQDRRGRHDPRRALGQARPQARRAPRAPLRAGHGRRRARAVRRRARRRRPDRLRRAVARDARRVAVGRGIHRATPLTRRGSERAAARRYRRLRARPRRG